MIEKTAHYQGDWESTLKLQSKLSYCDWHSDSQTNATHIMQYIMNNSRFQFNTRTHYDKTVKYEREGDSNWVWQYHIRLSNNNYQFILPVIKGQHASDLLRAGVCQIAKHYQWFIYRYITILILRVVMIILLTTHFVMSWFVILSWATFTWGLHSAMYSSLSIAKVA